MIRVIRLSMRLLAIGWIAAFVALVVAAVAAPAAVADNCSVFSDCFGQSEAASEAALGLTALAALSLVIDFIGGRGATGLAGRTIFGGGDSSGWDRALGLLGLESGESGATGLFGGLLEDMPSVGPWAELSVSGEWWHDLFGGPEMTSRVTGAVDHFFGTDVFDGERWSNFVGELVEGGQEISSLQPGSVENLRLALNDPEELMSRYGSFGLGVWDFATGLAVMAYDVSSVSPGTPAFFIEMNRWQETGEHRGFQMAGNMAVTADQLSSLNPGSASFYQELGEVIETGSIADHEGLQTAGSLVVSIVDWETFKDDPSKWAGGIFSEIALDVATGGAARGAGLSDNAARAAAQVVDADLARAAGAVPPGSAVPPGNAVPGTVASGGSPPGPPRNPFDSAGAPEPPSGRGADGGGVDETSTSGVDGTRQPSSGSTSSEVPRQTGAGSPYEGADEVYDAIRESTADVDSIASSTGFSRSDVVAIKEHLFYKEHYLDRYEDLGIPGEWRRFDSDPAIADAWQRLESGTHTPDDIQLLNHELTELRYMERTGNPSYSAAHDYAESVFPAPKSGGSS